MINYRSFIDLSSIFYQSNPDDVNRTNRTPNQLNAIERNRNSIKFYPEFAIVECNQINRILRQFSVRLIRRSFNQSNQSNVDNQSNAIERKTPIERNRILPRNWLFDCVRQSNHNYSITFDWFDCDFRLIAFD